MSKGGKLKFKAQKPKGDVITIPEGSVSEHQGKMSFSYKDLDVNQGQTLEDWDSSGLLLELNLKLATLSKLKPLEAFNSKSAKKYPAFPPKDKTEFSHPKHVAQDAQWCVLHIKGKEVIVGHLVGSVFYIVFLDKEHRFWISEKKNT